MIWDRGNILKIKKKQPDFTRVKILKLVSLVMKSRYLHEK